jgi:hypothetical protein
MQVVVSDPAIHTGTTKLYIIRAGCVRTYVYDRSVVYIVCSLILRLIDRVIQHFVCFLFLFIRREGTCMAPTGPNHFVIIYVSHEWLPRWDPRLTSIHKAD